MPVRLARCILKVVFFAADDGEVQVIASSDLRSNTAVMLAGLLEEVLGLCRGYLCGGVPGEQLEALVRLALVQAAYFLEYWRGWPLPPVAEPVRDRTVMEVEGAVNALGLLLRCLCEGGDEGEVELATAVLYVAADRFQTTR